MFLNDGDFSEEFRDVTTAAAAGGPTRYGKIAPEHWGYPSWVPERKAAEARRQQVSGAAGFGCFAQCLPPRLHCSQAVHVGAASQHTAPNQMLQLSSERNYR